MPLGDPVTAPGKECALNNHSVLVLTSPLMITSSSLVSLSKPRLNEVPTTHAHAQVQLTGPSLETLASVCVT